MQRDLSLLTVPPDGLLVRVFTHAYDHVVEGPSGHVHPSVARSKVVHACPKAQREEWLAWRLAIRRVYVIVI